MVCKWSKTAQLLNGIGPRFFTLASVFEWFKISNIELYRFQIRILKNARGLIFKLFRIHPLKSANDVEHFYFFITHFLGNLNPGGLKS